MNTSLTADTTTYEIVDGQRNQLNHSPRGVDGFKLAIPLANFVRPSAWLNIAALFNLPTPINRVVGQISHSFHERVIDRFR